MIIEDGTGSGNKAAVNDRKELETRARTETAMHRLSEADGVAHWVTTGGFVALLAATGESAVLRLENTCDVNIHVYWSRSCGTAVSKWRLVRHATGGTIESGTLVPPKNLNSQSTRIMDAEARVGADGSTVIGGEHLTQWINNVGHSNDPLEGAVLLAPGHNLVWMCEVLADADVCVSALVTEGD